MKKFRKPNDRQVRNILAKGISLALIGGITIMVLHPSIWIGFIWSGLHFLIVYGVASCVCRCLFGKSIMTGLREGFGDKEEIETEPETEESTEEE